MEPIATTGARASIDAQCCCSAKRLRCSADESWRSAARTLRTRQAPRRTGGVSSHASVAPSRSVTFHMRLSETTTESGGHTPG
ncbi:hypothetical protein [Gordonia sp. (in: high G+C Gram-positive bacteria)]|uniref:hypothetical protein n=1 Tax=Gordonia sp. (in: high G+C Gram-positive bacteria) TaxID=84139 RepID=UPI00262DEBCD|nr:hypothetical protein [Gordonia sp. (in: high G+C Gram-positive bacteria)]